MKNHKFIVTSKKPKELNLNPILLKFLDMYVNFELAGKTFPVPYFINTSRKRDLRALMGKGTPEEIMLETKVWAQVKGLNLENLTSDEIRQFMTDVGIGIDCSGLVVHSLQQYLKKVHNKYIYKEFVYKRQSLRAKIARFLRPAENLGANDLTSQRNTSEISVKDVKPGDFLRGVGKRRNAYHIAIVTAVRYHTQQLEIPCEIDYVHSHRYYGGENGVRKKTMKVVDVNANYLQQDWSQDTHTDGRNYLYEDISTHPEDSGFRRPNFYKHMKLSLD